MEISSQKKISSEPMTFHTSSVVINFFRQLLFTKNLAKPIQSFVLSLIYLRKSNCTKDSDQSMIGILKSKKNNNARYISNLKKKRIINFHLKLISQQLTFLNKIGLPNTLFNLTGRFNYIRYLLRLSTLSISIENYF